MRETAAPRSTEMRDARNTACGRTNRVAVEHATTGRQTAILRHVVVARECRVDAVDACRMSRHGGIQTADVARIGADVAIGGGNIARVRVRLRDVCVDIGCENFTASRDR